MYFSPLNFHHLIKSHLRPVIWSALFFQQYPALTASPHVLAATPRSALTRKSSRPPALPHNLSRRLPPRLSCPELDSSIFQVLRRSSARLRLKYLLLRVRERLIARGGNPTLSEINILFPARYCFPYLHSVSLYWVLNAFLLCVKNKVERGLLSYSSHSVFEPEFTRVLRVKTPDKHFPAKVMCNTSPLNCSVQRKTPGWPALQGKS